MHKKIFFILTSCLFIGWVYLIQNIFPQKNLSSSAILLSCDSDMIREKRETHQKTLSQLQTLDLYFEVRKCNTAGWNNNQEQMCAFLQKEKKILETEIEEYNTCRKQLYEKNLLDESYLSENVQTDKIDFGTPQFVHAHYSCKSAVGLTTKVGTQETLFSPTGSPFDTSFDGGFYRITYQSNQKQTLYKTHIDPIISSEKWDPSFSFLWGDYSDVKEIIKMQEYADKSLYVVYKWSDNNYSLVETEINGLQKKNTKKVLLDIVNTGTNQILFLQEKKIAITGTDKNQKQKTFVMNVDGSEITVWREPLPKAATLLGQQPNGQILYESYGNLGRVSMEGLIDTKYLSPKYSNKSQSCGIHNLSYHMIPNGTIVLVWNFSHINNVPRNCMALLDTDGNVIEKFDPGKSFWFGDKWWFKTVNIMDDGQGKIIAAGTFVEYNGFKQEGFARINNDGSPDTTFLLNGIPPGPLSQLTNDNYKKIIWRNGDIISENYSFSPKRIIENKECYNGNNQNNNAREPVLNICHKDDFERGMYKIGNKIYVPGGESIKIYEFSSLKFLKEIKRDSRFMPNNYWNNAGIIAGLVDGVYLYVGWFYGIDVIDSRTDEVVKVLWYHLPDQSPVGTIPTDTVATFDYNGDTYVIREDRMIYKVVWGKPMSVQEKYITGDSRQLYNARDLNAAEAQKVFINVGAIGKVWEDIYVVARDRIVIIDSKTQDIVTEFKYDPEPYDSYWKTIYNGYGGSATFNIERQNFSYWLLMVANGKFYVYASYGTVSQNIHLQQIKWFVFDTKTRKLTNVLMNPPSSDPLTDEWEKWQCAPVKEAPSSFFVDGKNIYMRYHNQNLFFNKYPEACKTMVLDTTTDTFSVAKNIPNNIDKELDLLVNSTFFNLSPKIRYAKHVFTWDESIKAYRVVSLEDNKRLTKPFQIWQISSNTKLMQYGDAIYTANTLLSQLDKIELNQGSLSCTNEDQKN